MKTSQLLLILGVGALVVGIVIFATRRTPPAPTAPVGTGGGGGGNLQGLGAGIGLGLGTAVDSIVGALNTGKAAGAES